MKKRTASECWEQSGISGVCLRLTEPKHLPHSSPCYHAHLLAQPGPTEVGMATLRPGPEVSVPTSICLGALYFMSLGLSWEIHV